MSFLEPLSALLLAFGASFSATPVVARMAVNFRAVDRPSARGVNQRPDVPLMGGLAVLFGLLAGLALGSALAQPGEILDRRMLGFLLGALLLVGAGVWDDCFGMKAPAKLGLQVLAAAIAVAHGFEVSRFTDPITRTLLDVPTPIGWAASFLWIVGITNALNLLDGMDGLATGVGSIIAVTLTVIAWQVGSPFGIFMGFALIGALMGFLPHNFPPARVFLGDTGSLLLGYALALLALDGYQRVSLITFVVPLLALAVPILDTTLSIARRIYRRQPLFRADRLHMHHRILALQGNTRSALMQFYFLTAAFCLLALSIRDLGGSTAAGFLILVLLLTARMLRNMGLLRFADDPEEDDATLGTGGST
jgi:UDP-GlcNAc:undecaprenyl-phosphate GlcNAc-1-phosphate transferase